MEEIVRIRLDNEMDLILAHKRTMKLSELCGLSVSSQTIFATAVSEIARCSISIGSDSLLILSINFLAAGKKEISASVFDKVDLIGANNEAIAYARRLIGNIDAFEHEGVHEFRLKHHIAFSGTITSAKIASLKHYFTTEPPLSPYDEIRKKNILLIEMSNKLKESENEYRMLTDTLPLMMFAINPRGEAIYYNKWLKDYFATGDTITSHPPWQSWVHPDDYRGLFIEWEKSQAHKTTLRVQVRLKTKNKDEYLWHLVTIVSLKNEHALNLGWIGFFVDINAQKLIEETLKDNKELKQVQWELKENQSILERKIRELNISNHDLEQFAYIASHDLQEPLRKIITFSSMIGKNQELTDINRHYFYRIISASDQMSSLIRDVLNYSRLTDSRKNMTETDLNTIMNDVMTDYDMQISEAGATFNLQQLPIIYGIPLQLTQLFSNLLNNSLKFTSGKPQIEISCKTEELNKEGELMLFHKMSFSDNGIGFDPEYAGHIFDIFKRLNTREDYKGTGIGLALCKKVMENHKGLITADSAPGKGATFTMYFPVNQAEATDTDFDPTYH